MTGTATGTVTGIDRAEWLLVLNCMTEVWSIGVESMCPLVIYREGTRERLTVERVTTPDKAERWAISGPGEKVIHVRTGNPPDAVAATVERRLLPRVRAYLSEHPETDVR